MTFLSKTEPYQQILIDIIENAPELLYTAKITINNPDYPDFVLTIPFFEYLVIQQSFVINYCNSVLLSLDMLPEQYLEIIRYHGGLRVTIELFYYRDKAPTTENTSPFVTLHYRALIQNPIDLERLTSKEELYPGENTPTRAQMDRRIPTVLELITDDEYVIRKFSFGTILQNAKPTDAVWAFCKAVGIRKCAIYTPPNQPVYSELVIRPMQNIGSLTEYLHEEYGLYKATCYYTNGTLYVYPTWKVEGNSDNTIHIYKIDFTRLVGAKGFHKYDKDDLHIISNSMGKINMSSMLDVENVGNSLILQNIHRAMEGWHEITEDGSYIEFTDEGLQSKIKVIDSPVAHGLLPESHLAKFRYDNGNPVKALGHFDHLGISGIEIEWSCAVPFTVQPYQKMLYHYEKKEEYVAIPATCIEVVYTIERMNRPTEPIYSCNANLKLITDEGLTKI
jgi:hypothetical protein